MNDIHDTPLINTVTVPYQLAGFHLDYSLGQEAPLFPPPTDKKLLFGVGYNSKDQRRKLGMPVHRTDTTSYRAWRNMMQRCYWCKRNTAYEGCSVCPKWHDFQEFADWYEDQPYANRHDAELDKDILDPLNTIYSPEYCSVVPKIINVMFRNTRSMRGDLPLGVTERADGKAVVARISKYGEEEYLGSFICIFEAAKAYGDELKNYARELADFYDNQIDYRVMERLLNVRVHIRD